MHLLEAQPVERGDHHRRDTLRQKVPGCVGTLADAHDSATKGDILVVGGYGTVRRTDEQNSKYEVFKAVRYGISGGLGMGLRIFYFHIFYVVLYILETLGNAVAPWQEKCLRTAPPKPQQWSLDSHTRNHVRAELLNNALSAENA